MQRGTDPLTPRSPRACPPGTQIQPKATFGLADEPSILAAVESDRSTHRDPRPAPRRTCASRSRRSASPTADSAFVVVSDATFSPGAMHDHGLAHLRDAGVEVTPRQGHLLRVDQDARRGPRVRDRPSRPDESAGLRPLTVGSDATHRAPLPFAGVRLRDLVPGDALYVVADPLLLSALFLGLTHGMTDGQRREVAWRGPLIAFVILVGVGLGGGEAAGSAGHLAVQPSASPAACCSCGRPGRWCSTGWPTPGGDSRAGGRRRPRQERRSLPAGDPAHRRSGSDHRD